jgi:hypothetical protein
LTNGSGGTLIAHLFLTVFLVATTSLTRFIAFPPWVFLFQIPAVGMCLWSEEK